MRTEKIISERIAYIDKCPICKKEIKAFSKSSLKYNMKLHIEKHKKNE